METVGVSRAGTGRADVAETGRKVATTKDQLGKKTVASELRNGLPAATVDGELIAKLEEG